jgi:nicotinamide-nucleotide amidase
VAVFLGRPLVLHAETFRRIEAVFRKMKWTMSPSNRRQAEVPEGVDILDNPAGLAPGVAFSRGGRLGFVLPGVPSEMKAILETGVLPRLKALPGVPEAASVVLRLTGVGEANVNDKLTDFPTLFPALKLEFLPSASCLRIRLFGFGPEVKKQIQSAENEVRNRFGLSVYGSGEDTLESVVADLFIQRKLTLATAESCTGGLISHKLTNIPGSSNFFNRGIVAYSNEAKVELLGVPAELIQQHGAVSRQVAEAMAKGVRAKAGTDIGLAVTGIAGPGGGTPEKPVGLVFIAFADATQVVVEEHCFHRDRIWNKERTAVAALDLVRRMMLDQQVEWL